MDPRTLSIALAAVCLAAAAIVSLMALYGKKAALRVYALGFVSATLGVTASLIPGKAGSLPGIVLFNLLSGAFLFFLVWGWRLSSGARPALPRRFALWVGLGFLLLLAGTFVWTSYRLRALSNSLFSVLMSLEFVFAFRRVESERGREIRVAVRFQCLGYTAFHIVRVLLVFLAGDTGTNLLSGGAASSFYLVGSLFFFVSWAGLILALNAEALFRELEEKNRALKQLAVTDELTGLYNRHLLDQKLREESDRARRYHHELTLIMFDLDHFKRVNDDYGHKVGDEVLVSTAKTTSGIIREQDSIFRWGGEEFVILAPNTPLSGAIILAEKIRRAIAETRLPAVGGITASFGVTAWQEPESIEAWFKRVDLALYRAKNAGRNRVVAFSAADSAPVAMVRVEWRPEWESGDAEVDEQHRSLLETASHLLDLSLSSAGDEEIKAQLDRLLAHLMGHFAAEEAMLRRVGYPEAQAHGRLHRELTKEAEAIKERYLEGSLEASELFDFLIGKIITGHLLAADVKFFPWTRQERRETG